MVFDFNPSLWFVCKLCRETFPDTDKLKAHKLENHLGECLNIKCIVFEEKLLDHKWTPSSQEFAANQDDQLVNSNTALPQEQINHTTNVKPQLALKRQQKQQNIKFKNPYVSLTTLTAAQELNSSSAVSSKTKLIISAKPLKSTVGSTHSFGVGGENRILLTKRKLLNSVTEDLPSNKQPKTEEPDDDDAHKNRIRELLSNVVLIKSEPNNDTDPDHQVHLEPQELPISIVSTYSLPPPSNNATSNGNVYFNSLRQQQQHQLQLHKNSKAVLPSTSKNFETRNNPSVSQIIPTFFKQSFSYPANNGRSSQVRANKFGSHLRTRYPYKINYTNRLNTTASSYPSTSTSTSALGSNTFTGKVEFIDSDLVEHNRNLETIAIENPTQPLRGISGDLFQAASVSATNSLTSDVLEKPFVCKICSASFKKNHQLTQHLFIHSGSRPFQCPQCDAKFKSKSNLRGHSISRHGKDSLFKCRYCGKSVPSRANLISHESTHTGFKHYKCDFPNCVDKFKCNASLYVHKRIVHGEELGLQRFACPICGDRFVFQSQLNSHQKKEHVNPVVMEILP